MRPMQRTDVIGASSRTVGLFVLVVACSTPVLAQNRAPILEPTETTVGAIPGAQPTFRAGVTLVTTDIIVRDEDGLFLPDLTRDDFEIFEDGIPQEIASLTLVHGGRVFDQLQPPPPARAGIILPTARPQNETAGRIFILFVDDLHLVTSLTPKVRQIAMQIAENLIHEGDLFGIISTGPSSLSIDMTYDHQVLTDAINRITGDGFAIREYLYQQETSRGPTEVLYRAHVAFKTAREVLRNLEEVTDRRKVFLYLSNGYDFNPFPGSRAYSGGINEQRRIAADDLSRGALSQENFDARYGDIPDALNDPFQQAYRQGQQFANTDLAFELAELTRVANRANTSFYTIDPRGLMAGPNIDDRVPIEEWSAWAFQTQNSLRMLAELTGGMAVVNRNDFPRAFRQIDAETSDYYIVGFYTSNPDPTIRNRTLRIDIAGRDELSACGDCLRYRREYSMPRVAEEQQ
jgi:VWFA-related protein